MNSEGFHICVFSMSGWAVFPYQHTSPLWGEVQLSILCTGSQTGGSDPNQDTLGSGREESSHLRAGSASSYPLPALPAPKVTGNQSPGSAGDAQGTLGLQLWSQAPLPWPPQHPPNSWVPCTAPGSALPGISCTIPAAGTASGTAAFKTLLSKQQSKDQPVLKSVLLQTFRLILKIAKVNGVMKSPMNHLSKSKTL